MKFLFVGGPEHGKVQHAEPYGLEERWITRQALPLNINEFSSDVMSVNTVENVYYVKEIQLFDEIITVLILDGKEISMRVLDAIIKPEVRDLMRRL